MSRIRVTIDADCVERLKKDKAEFIRLPNGDAVEICWSDEKVEPSANRMGGGCYVEVELS
jgi:hypothetical protein